MRKRTLLLLCQSLLILVGLAKAELKVASLHPLMSDLARQVGGDKVEVVSLMKPKGDPHHFEPGARELRQADGAALYLASGKGFEVYLPKLKRTLAGRAEIMEVGRMVPSITVSGGNALFVCCPEHARGSLDPHWWHSIYNMRKATFLVADKFGELDPANRSYYRARAKAYSKRLDQLKRWASNELSRIPRERRRLATAHAAFGYFCKEFGFKSLPVQGLNKEQAPTASYIKEVTERIRSEKVRAVFPESGANPKTLRAVARATGVKIGGSLNADGMAKSYEAFMRHNINTVVKALAN